MAGVNWGTVPLNSVIPFYFDTYDGQLGGSLTMTGLAVTDIEVYKGVSMTQRSSDTGYTLLDTDGIDVDGVTGIHAFSIDTSSDADAGFFVAGSFYTVVVASITVDAVTVNFVAGTFYLTPAMTIAGQQKVDVGGWLGTAPATPTVNGVPEVDPTHWNGTAVSTPSTAGIVEVNVKNAANVAWGSGAITAASIATDAIGAAEIADGAITAATFAASAIDAASIATGAITAAKFAAGAIDAAAIANNAIDAATFAADVDAEILSYVVDDATRIDASALNTASVTSVPAILVDTNELQVDWVNGGRLDLILDIIAADTTTDIPALIDALPTNAELATALGTADDAVLAAVATVQSDTDNIQTRLPAALVGGRMDSSVGAMAADVLTAAALATDAVTEVVAAVWNALKATYNAVGSFGHANQDVIRQNTATAGGAATITLDGSASSTTDFYKDDWIKIVQGTGSAGQPRRITAYNGTTKVATVDPAWDTQPDGTSQFAIF